MNLFNCDNTNSFEFFFSFSKDNKLKYLLLKYVGVLFFEFELVEILYLYRKVKKGKYVTI